MNSYNARCGRKKRIALIGATAAVLSSFGVLGEPSARGDEWKNPAGGAWENGANWVDGTPPASTSGGSEWAFFHDQVVGGATVVINGTITATSNIVSTGATFYNTGGVITFDLGAGRTWNPPTFVLLGELTTIFQKPSVVLQSGTIISNGLLNGNNSQTEGHFTVTGPNSLFTAGSLGIRVGSADGSNSTLLVSNGGKMTSTAAMFVGLQTAQNCDLTITDPGSKITVNAGTTVGGGIDPAVDAGHNTVHIVNGGSLETGQLLMGVGGTFANAPGNTLTLSGANSLLTLTAKTDPTTTGTLAAAVGHKNNDNTMTIDGGATLNVVSGDIRIGNNDTSFNNLIHMVSGTLTMAGSGDLTTAGSGRFDSRRGKFWIENGSAALPALIANTGGDSLLQLDGGNVTVKNANVNNGSPLLIGNGAGVPMTYQMNGPFGTHTFANGVTVQSDGSLLGAATIVGNVTNNNVMATGASAGTLKIVGSLGINTGAGAKTDISNNPMIVTNSPVGTWDGVNNYTDITGLIKSGRNGGSWTGPGIITSQSTAAGSNFTTIGVANAAEVKHLTAGSTETATWAGQTVTATDTLVLYTYGGDANLDGRITVDDYGRIDFNVGLGTAGWFNGDFNYDGKITVDDYGIIDFNVGIQGPPFPTGSGLAGVSAVPEPGTSMILLVAGAAGARLMRRRGR